MTSAARSMTGYEWLLLLALSCLWGGAFFFIAVALEDLPPFTLVALRLSLAAMVLLGVVYLSGLRLPGERSIWLAFLGMGVLNNVIPFSLIVWGQTQIASGLASILNATTPFFTVLAAHFLTKDERLTGLRLAGISIGFTGVVIMIGHEALYGLGEKLFGQLAIMGAALSYAFAGIFGRRFRRLGVKPLVTATGQVITSTVLLVPLALSIDRPWNLAPPGWEAMAAVVGLALFSTAFAYIIYFRILATAGATNVLLVTLIIPISAIILGSAVLKEQLEVKHFVGMGLIGLGLLTIDGRLFRFVRHRFFPRPAVLSPADKNS